MLPVTDLLIRSSGRDNAPALVLLHVFGLSRREWIETGVALAPQFRVVSIDTPGFGDADESTGYSVSDMADCFAETIGLLRLDRYVLVGHSMTGKVAAVMASRGLPGLQKLVLLTPSPPCPEPITPKARATMLQEAEPTRANANAYLHANSCLPIKPDVWERSVEDRLYANPDAWRAWLEGGSLEDWSERVGVLELPSLVIAAEKDSSLGPAVQRELTLPHLGNARMEIVPGSGHLVPLEAPEKLAGLLREFAGS